MSERVFFQPVRSTPEYILYQASYTTQDIRRIAFYNQDTKINPMDYVAVAKGAFNQDASPEGLLGELFHIYNFQEKEMNETILANYAGRSMSSGDIIELRYPDGLVLTWLCCSSGWHKLGETHLYSL